MSNTSVLQVRLSPELRDQAEAKALDMGLGSLQDAVRVFLKRMVTGELSIGVVKEPDEFITLTPRAKKRYDQMDKDFAAGKNIYVADSPKDLLDQLYGRKNPVQQDIP